MGSAEPNIEETMDKEKLIVNEIIEKPKDSLVKYGVVQFGNNASVKIPLGDYLDESQLKDHIRKLSLTDGRALNKGIETAGNEFEKNGRPKARQIMVVFIDGNDKSSGDELAKVARHLHEKDIKIIPVVLKDNVRKEKLKPLLLNNKTPIKGKDPQSLAHEAAEEVLKGEQ